MDEFAETLGTLDFLDPNLDKLRQETLLLYGSDPDLDPDGVNNYLKSRGYSELIESILDPAVYIHAGFARAEAAHTSVRVGIGEMVDGLREDGQRADMAEAEKAYAENIQELGPLVEKLNELGTSDPDGKPWTQQSFVGVMLELGK